MEHFMREITNDYNNKVLELKQESLYYKFCLENIWLDDYVPKLSKLLYDACNTKQTTILFNFKSKELPINIKYFETFVEYRSYISKNNFIQDKNTINLYDSSLTEDISTIVAYNIISEYSGYYDIVSEKTMQMAINNIKSKNDIDKIISQVILGSNKGFVSFLGKMSKSDVREYFANLKAFYDNFDTLNIENKLHQFYIYDKEEFKRLLKTVIYNFKLKKYLYNLK